MANCRKCKYADWYIVNGRRRFGNWAECTAPIDASMLPASANEIRRLLEDKRTVASYENKEIECSRFEKIK